MKVQKLINVYYFNELTEEIQNKVHEENRYFLTENYSYNFDEIVDEFKNFVESIGGAFIDDFVGYDTDGYRVITKWKGDFIEFLSKIGNSKNYLGNEKLPKLKIRKNFLDIMQSDSEYSEYEVVGGAVTFSGWYRDKNIKLRVLKEDRDKLYNWMYEVLNIINNCFLNKIRAEQDYLETKEAFAEYCELNEVLFTKNGIRVN
jgi:hypothetical protein